MSTALANMTKRELQEMIEAALEHKLLEMLGDPDKGLQLRANIRNRLSKQRKDVVSGARGHAIENVLPGLK